MGRSLVVLLRNQLDHVVNAEDSYGCLGGKTDRVDLGYHWFQHSGLQVVSGNSLGQVQAAVFQIQLLLVSFSLLLGSSVQGSQFRDQLSGVLSSIDS